MKGIAISVLLLIPVLIAISMFAASAINSQTLSLGTDKKTDCINKPCGFFVSGGVCDGAGNVYQDGACMLSCTPPATGPTTERIVVGKCGRVGSIKCSVGGACNLNSCGSSSACNEITGGWSDVQYPAGFYARNVGTDVLRINVVGAYVSQQGWTPLIECKIKKSDGNSVILDYWKAGDVTLEYTLKPQDPLGDWSVEYCFLATDYLENGGWYLTTAGTPPEPTTPTLYSYGHSSLNQHKPVSSPIPLYSQWWVPVKQK